MVTRRSSSDPQLAQRQSPARCPHQPHVGVLVAVDMPSGPVQTVQRAAWRQARHATSGAYPGRATWMRTGPCSTASLAARQAPDGIRACRAKPSSPVCDVVGMTRGVRVAAGETLAR